MVQRKIPSTGEALAAIGLGTWQTFDVSAEIFPKLQEVLNVLHQAGGSLLDSSPMYGRSEEVIGSLTEALPQRNEFFYATKVWTRGAAEGKQQMQASFKKMKREAIDLMQIHNLVDWQTHLPLLRSWKEEGRIRYIGITHYTDDSHAELERIIKKEPVDFVQFNYSIFSRHAEKSLLPLCAGRGVATIINRPFGEGALFRQVAGKPLPDWIAGYGIDNWSAYFLKFILSHPAVTCVIPATGNPVHAIENIKAGKGDLPDNEVREKMAAYVRF